jgi:hypothetical protein
MTSPSEYGTLREMLNQEELEMFRRAWAESTLRAARKYQGWPRRGRNWSVAQGNHEAQKDRPLTLDGMFGRTDEQEAKGGEAGQAGPA